MVVRVRSLERPQVLRSDAPLCSCLPSLPFGLRDLAHHRSLGMGAAATKRRCGTFVSRDPPPRACGIPKRRERSPVPDRAPVRPVLAGCAPSGPAPTVRPRAPEPAPCPGWCPSTANDLTRPHDLSTMQLSGAVIQNRTRTPRPELAILTPSMSGEDPDRYHGTDKADGSNGPQSKPSPEASWGWRV